MGWKIPEGTLVKQDIIRLLQNLDNELYSNIGKPKYKYSAYIVGGAAIILHGLDEKMTADIDLVEVSSIVSNFLRRQEDNIINDRADACLSDFPYDFPDRAYKLNIDTKAIDFYVVSIEDIIVSKLATPRTKDRIDIRRDDVINYVNWQLLDELIQEQIKEALNETRGSILKAQYKEYLKDVDELKKRIVNYRSKI